MANAKQRMKNRNTSLQLMYNLPPKHTCKNCGHKMHECHGHYFPASFGDCGFFICETLLTKAVINYG